MSSGQKKANLEYVDYKRACALDLPHRLAWASEVVGRIVGLYSPYFQERYLQKAAVDVARRFSLGQSISEELRRSVIHDIEDRVEEAEAEGYSRSLLAPGVDLLLEIECDDGKGTANAAGNAANAYAAHLLFRQGVRGMGLPVEYIDGLADRGYKFACEMFNLVRQYRDAPISSIPFTDVTLDVRYPKLSAEEIRKFMRKPPIRESEYIAMTAQKDNIA
jgi:hypothetical protein